MVLIAVAAFLVAQQRTSNSSQFRGVSLNKASGKWEARIREAGRNHYLGSFNGEADAARAFDAAALAMRGQAAVCNFPQSVPGVQVCAHELSCC